MKFEYVPVLAMLVLSALVPGLFLAASAVFAPRCPSVVKQEPFECGNVSSGPAWGRFSVKFYLTAILFIVFDVEVVFLYPWALLFRRLGIFGFVEMMIFISVLAFGWSTSGARARSSGTERRASSLACRRGGRHPPKGGSSPRLAAGYYSVILNAASSRGSARCIRMYSALTSSFTLPLVQSKYPRAHRCRPQNSVRNRRQSCSSRWLRLATEGNTCAERAREASCRLPERRRHAPPTALAHGAPRVHRRRADRGADGALGAGQARRGPRWGAPRADRGAARPGGASGQPPGPAGRAVGARGCHRRSRRDHSCAAPPALTL